MQKRSNVCSRVAGITVSGPGCLAVRQQGILQQQQFKHTVVFTAASQLLVLSAEHKHMTGEHCICQVSTNTWYALLHLLAWVVQGSSHAWGPVNAVVGGSPLCGCRPVRHHSSEGGYADAAVHLAATDLGCPAAAVTSLKAADNLPWCSHQGCGSSEFSQHTNCLDTLFWSERLLSVGCGWLVKEASERTCCAMIALLCCAVIAVCCAATTLQWYGWPMLSVEAVETFFQAITFALTLMLVFKTNSSYARWWEARAKVGLLTSTAHDMARAVSGRVQV